MKQKPFHIFHHIRRKIICSFLPQPFISGNYVKGFVHQKYGHQTESLYFAFGNIDYHYFSGSLPLFQQALGLGNATQSRMYHKSISFFLFFPVFFKQFHRLFQHGRIKGAQLRGKLIHVHIRRQALKHLAFCIRSTVKYIFINLHDFGNGILNI